MRLVPACNTWSNVVQVRHIRYIVWLGCLQDLVFNAWPEIINAHVPQRGQRWKFLTDNVILKALFIFAAIDIRVVFNLARESSSATTQDVSVALQIRLFRHNGSLILPCGALTRPIREWIKVDLPLDAIELLIEMFHLVLEELAVFSCVVIENRIQE